MRSLFALPLLVLAVLSPHAATAAESFDGCKYEITSLPAILVSQGVWCLKGDLATSISSGNAITIASNNITLDCNGFKLGGLGAGLGTSTRGVAFVNRSGVVVRNCNIRGFRNGVAVEGGVGNSIESNIFEGNTAGGIDGSVGISTGLLIRDNRINDTGGSTNDPTPVGIFASGEAHIIDNIISGVSGDGAGDDFAVAIYLTNGGGMVTGNRIVGTVPDGTGTAVGIFISTGQPILVENLINGGHVKSIGIQCVNTEPTTRNNTMVGVTTPVSLCTSTGNYNN